MWLLRILCTVGGWFVSDAQAAELSAIPITIHRHTSVTMVDEGDVDLTILPLANTVLQTKDHATNDVACPIAMHRSGQIGTFSYGDGVVATQANEDQILPRPLLGFGAGTYPPLAHRVASVRGTRVVDKAWICPSRSDSNLYWN